MPKQHLNPEELFPSLQYGFSQIVTANPGKMIFIAGQVAWDAEQNIVGGRDLKAQMLQAFSNVQKALRVAGANLSDVVAMRLYIVDYDPQQAPEIVEVINTVFADLLPPACTWIGVAALANEDFLIEIEVTAVVEAEST